ncbi:tetratricopeptide repeat protein [Kordia sp. YSTF-M3]|uniref:Tetratricopeptide repeat protein n=1 Tax=Kordia aestuariivivens TaxID=2759037 RepID=A0ABR7QFE3_9FLAO|nr:tetratricopeptide repeat protein [Kordia aestuariivivens]MBC8757285.1 tetratricopeptide repeat protein [Kordia aestuariivivens]
MNNFRIILSLVLIFLSLSIYAQSNISNIDDSYNTIISLLEKIDNKSISDSIRYNLSKEAYSLTKKLQNDSLKNRVLQQCVLFSYRNEDWKQFNVFRAEHLPIARSLSDSLAIAKNFDYGAYYHKVITNNLDSVYKYYYSSYKIYDALKDSLGAGKMKLNIAIVKKNVHDYKGSETASVDALKYLVPIKAERRIASVYNNLGIIFNQYKNWNKALEYHQKSAEIRERFDKRIYYLHSLNNIGKVYKDSGDYAKAEEYFKEILSNDSIISQAKHVWFKAVVIDNLAHARFKENPQLEVLPDFMEALKIREDKKAFSGMVISYIHLAEYHKEKENFIKARDYAEKAGQLAHDTHNYRDYLKSQELLLHLYDEVKYKKLLDRYIFVRDSLDKVDRIQENRFAIVEFEVDAKDKQITSLKVTTKKGKRYIAVLAISMVSLTIFLIFLIIRKVKQGKNLKESKSELKKTEHQLLEQTQEQATSNDDNLFQYHQHLSDTYNISKKLLEYWVLKANRFTNQQIADRLKITLGATKKRNALLLHKIFEIEGKQDVDKYFLVNLYAKKLREFKNRI